MRQPPKQMQALFAPVGPIFNLSDAVPLS